MKFICVLALVLSVSCEMFANGEIFIPATTAYIQGSEYGATVHKAGGASWRDASSQFMWGGHFLSPGRISCEVEVEIDANQKSSFYLQFGEQIHSATVTGKKGGSVRVHFGSFNVTQAGYHRFVLGSQNPDGLPPGNPVGLILSGPAAEGAHFNLSPWRRPPAARMKYPLAANFKATAFYCEVTPNTSPAGTLYVACGWHFGLLGLNVGISPKGVVTRSVRFQVSAPPHSVEESAAGLMDEKPSQRVEIKLLKKGIGVLESADRTPDFGARSDLECHWEIGETHRFVVVISSESLTGVVCSAYYSSSSERDWRLLSSYFVPDEVGWMTGLYSSVGSDCSDTGHLQRAAFHGNQWVRTEAGAWLELTRARFDTNSIGKAERLDRFMVSIKDRFYLSSGGFVDGSTVPGECFDRLGGSESTIEFVPPRNLR